jgi:surface antigen
MPAGLFSYSDYFAKLTPISSAAVNSVGYCKAWNSKTNKWDHATLGHVFIIDKVNSNGTLEISEGNVNGACKTSTITPAQRGTVKYWKPKK